MMMHNKRSQMEMFGIAFVVVLVALGMLFAVRFVINKPASQTKEQFTQKELAQNFVTTLLATSTGCKDTDITDLLEDCGSFKILDCTGKCGVPCQGCQHSSEPCNSCRYAEELTHQILEDTLKTWNRVYKFKASTAQQQLFNFSNGECIESRPGWGYIPLGAGGTLVVRLDVC